MGFCKYGMGCKIVKQIQVSNNAVIIRPLRRANLARHNDDTKPHVSSASSRSCLPFIAVCMCFRVSPPK